MSLRKVMVAALGALLLAGFLPQALSAAKVPINLYEISCALHEGTQWTSHNGKRVHSRGAMSYSIFYDAVTFEEAGGDSIVSNFTLRTASGVVDICGTFSGVFTQLSETATFDGTWRAKAKNGVFKGRAVGKGTFDLEDWTMKLSLRPVAQMPNQLAVILAGAPWNRCAEITGVGHVTGFARPKKVE